jgi:hypothetical protein
MDARGERQVLLDREVLVERELLGHVAHPPLDLARLPEHVEAQHRAGAGVGPQQPAQHPQRGGLARAVRPEKPQMRPPSTRMAKSFTACSGPKLLFSPARR